MKVHERLKDERERLGFSPLQMAELMGVGKNTVINWEKGSSAPDAMQLCVFAAAGGDVLFVLTGQSGPAPEIALTHEEQALVDNYRHADAEGRETARRVLSSLAQSKRKKA